MISEQDLQSIRYLIREELASPRVTDRILTLQEAVIYTKHATAEEIAAEKSFKAFWRWCAHWKVTSCSQGRYARSRLDSGLEREARYYRPKRDAPRERVPRVESPQ